MTFYLDASALVKRYLAEAASSEVKALLASHPVVGTARITRPEIAAALAKAARTALVSREEAHAALQAFRAQWPSFVRLELSEAVLALAEALAWEHGLRGYDAVHLASAASWQQTMGESVTLATFDQQLWQAGQKVGLAVWPNSLPRR